MKKDNSNFRTINLMYYGSVRPKNKCIYIPVPVMTNRNILLHSLPKELEACFVTDTQLYVFA